MKRNKFMMAMLATTTVPLAVFAKKQRTGIFLPGKVPHAWTQVSEKGKMTVIFQPAGKLEQFFVTMAVLKHEPTPQEVAQIFADNDMQVVGPPLKIN